jgi:hypothetical protein
MTVHIIDYFNSDNPHLSQWGTIVADLLRSEGYNVNVVRSPRTNLPKLRGRIEGDILYKSRIVEELIFDESYKIATKKDVFIFCDAWNPLVAYLRHLDMMLDMRWKFIGIWNESLIDTYSVLRLSLNRRPKQWANSFERALYNSYDVNCFINEESAVRFKKKYGLKTEDRIAVTGLPFDGLHEIRKRYTPVEKKNLIVIANDVVNNIQENILRAVVGDFPEYKFVMTSTHKFRDYEFYALLNEAKCIMSITTAESNPTNIYMGMVFDCIPLIPDSYVYSTIFSERYMYPHDYVTPPMLNVIKYREQMHEKIDGVINGYESELPIMRNHLQQVENQHFNSSKFLNVLKQITNGKK